MIQIDKIRAATISTAVDLPKFEQKQLGRKIEKFLLKQDIICEVRIR